MNTGNAYVRIAPHEERTFSFTRLWHGVLNGDPLAAWRDNYTQRDVMQDIRGRLRKYRELRTLARNYPSFNIGGANFEIDLMIRVPSLKRWSCTANVSVNRRPSWGLSTPIPPCGSISPSCRCRSIAPVRQILGVETDDIARALRLMVGGDDKVSQFRDPSLNEDYDVQLRLSEAYRNNPEVISRLYVPRQNGGLVRLDNVVQLVSAQSASRIDRVDRQRTINLRAAIAPGYVLADRLEILNAAAAALNMPVAYTTKAVGRGSELERTFREFIWAFLVALIFMYMILASQFESLVHPLTILLSLPLSVPFALLSLWYTGNSLNLYSALGMLVLFGVVKKNSILQIDHTNNLRATGMNRYDAIMEANRDRLRPILMTTLTLVAGMLPLALCTGPGAEERRAIAVVVIGGQSLSLLLTLIVTPVAYSLFDDLGLIAVWRPGRARWWGRRPRLVMAAATSTPTASLSTPLAASQPGADDGQAQQHHREAE